jgi:hypothetical protein
MIADLHVAGGPDGPRLVSYKGTNRIGVTIGSATTTTGGAVLTAKG